MAFFALIIHGFDCLTPISYLFAGKLAKTTGLRACMVRIATVSMPLLGNNPFQEDFS